MSRNLSHVLIASPPSWNTVSQHPTVVTYCTVLYGTGVQRVYVQVSTVTNFHNQRCIGIFSPVAYINIYYATQFTMQLFIHIKDYIEEIDFQEPFFTVVNWPIAEIYGASVCIMYYFDQSATNQLAIVFLIEGCGFLFYTQYSL